MRKLRGSTLADKEGRNSKNVLVTLLKQSVQKVPRHYDPQ